MHPVLKNVLAVIAGVISGSLVNMGIILASPFIIPPPEGAVTTTMEGLKASLHLFEFKHFIFPFLAHALGTFSGAFVTATIAASHKQRLALALGIYFLIGGITSVYMLPSPVWFAILDLGVSYIPMAILAGKWAVRQRNS